MPSEIKGSSNFDSDNAGKVLQILTNNSGTNGSELSTTSGSYASGGSECTITITPEKANSEIYVTANFNADSAQSNSKVMYTLYRSIDGGTYTNVVPSNTNGYDSLIRIHDLGSRVLVNQTIDWVDTTHNTTNSISYRIYFKNQTSGQTARIRNDITACIMVVQEMAQ